jgi:nucleoside-diphosphate kinase
LRFGCRSSGCFERDTDRERARVNGINRPDGVQRGAVGDIISRFEKKGMVLKGLKTYQAPKAVAEEHYQDLSSKPFFGDLVNYICSGPVVAMIWEGPGAVKSARLMIGETNPLVSNPGTIRGDWAVEVGRNIIHGSDSVESAEREIALWFGDKAGIVDWTPTNTPWVRE